VPAVEQLLPLYQLQAQMQQGQITLFTEQVHTLERAIQGDLLDTPAIQRLLWIPGIGRIVAFTLALEVDDIQRFPTVRHFWSYCRLVPGAADSGGRHRHRASKDGNRYLKLAFSHAAVRAIQYFPEVRLWYQRWKRKKPIRIARALVAKEVAKERLCGLARPGGLQPAVQRDATHAAEKSAVAPAGKPLCLTGLGPESRRVIGKPIGHAAVKIWDAVE
jgi:transposase